MNRRTAIRECKQLWGEIEKSGLGKLEFLDSPDGEKRRAKDYLNHCPLCELSWGYRCKSCPLVTQLGAKRTKNDDPPCYSLGFNDEEPSPAFWANVKKLKVHGG